MIIILLVVILGFYIVNRQVIKLLRSKVIELEKEKEKNKELEVKLYLLRMYNN